MVEQATADVKDDDGDGDGEQATVEANDEAAGEQAAVEANDEAAGEQAAVDVKDDAAGEQATVDGKDASGEQATADAKDDDASGNQPAVESNEESGTKQPTAEVLENYKGNLIQYCHTRGLPEPIYTEVQSGKQGSPSWKVTVRYGDWVYEMPEPIPGPKRLAHQIASREILAEIDARREKFLAGQQDEQKGQPASTKASQKPAKGSRKREKLEVPMHLVSRALTIANERLVASQPTRYRVLTDKEFSRRLAGMTLDIIRDLVKKAERDKITFV